MVISPLLEVSTPATTIAPELAPVESEFRIIFNRPTVDVIPALTMILQLHLI